jgi:two-component system cell cycle response regulator
MPHWDLTSQKDKFMAVKKLLVADDSLTIQKVIRLALAGMASGKASSSSGDTYDIQAVSDGNDAIQQISLFRPDIVLIDISLPGKSAFQVKRAINGQDDLSNVRFVLMSSAFEKIDEEQAEEVVFHGRLTKPFDPTHLREVLQEVLGSASSSSSGSRAPDEDDKDEPTVFFSGSSKIPSMPKTPSAPELPPMDFPSMDLPDDEFSSIDLPPTPPHDESDIRKLTESTLVMTGFIDENPEAGIRESSFRDSAFKDPTKEFTMAPPDAPSSDEFSWSVQETSLKPGTGILDIGNSTFNLNEEIEPPSSLPSMNDDPLDHSLPALPGLKSNPPSVPQNAPGIQLSSPQPSAPQTQASQAGKTQSVSKEEVEAMVRQQVEAALTQMARKILPEVAERIIKQEIRNLLEAAP